MTVKVRESIPCRNPTANKFRHFQKKYDRYIPPKKAISQRRTRDGPKRASHMGGTATAQADVDALVPPGSYAVLLTAANDDSTPQTGTCTLTVNVQDILPIGAVQGAVADGTDGRAHAREHGDR